jgi:hypothetical protein
MATQLMARAITDDVRTGHSLSVSFRIMKTSDGPIVPSLVVTYRALGAGDAGVAVGVGLVAAGAG